MTPKLVRDRIPDIIIANGEHPITRRLDDAAYHDALRAKLREEVDEYLGAPDDAAGVEELVDILEVIQALTAVHGANVEWLEMKRAEKARERGGFSERVFLIDVE